MALELLSFYCACCSDIGCCRIGLGNDDDDDDDGDCGDSLDGMSSNDCCTVYDGSFELLAAAVVDSGLVVGRTFAGRSSSSDYACAALGTGSRWALII